MTNQGTSMEWEVMVDVIKSRGRVVIVFQGQSLSMFPGNSVKTVEKQVPRENCQQVPQQNCQLVPRQKCQSIPVQVPVSVRRKKERRVCEIVDPCSNKDQPGGGGGGLLGLGGLFNHRGGANSRL